MTREEALKILKYRSGWNLSIRDVNALDMAIKALEEEPCEYAISRDDALKALDYDIKSFEFKSGVSRHMDDIAKLLNTIYEIQVNNIKALPHVQPKYNTNEWCHDCSEYDHEKHCCPRYNGVIRKAVDKIAKMESEESNGTR